MKTIAKYFFLASMILMAGMESHAATMSVQGTDTRIEYRKNQFTYDANYQGNSSATRALTRAIENAGEANIDFIRIVTYVTPTSSEDNDMALAEKRAVDTKWLIAEKFPKLQSRVIYETRRSSQQGDVSIVTVCLKSEMSRQTFTLANPTPAPSRRPASAKRRTVRSLPVEITSTTGDMFKDVRTDNPDVFALEAHLDYKVNEYTFDPNYMSNRSVLRALDKAIDEVGLENIDSVLVISFASPEGKVEHNQYLAEKRAIDTKWFILKQYPELQDRVVNEGHGESWEGLRQLVENDRMLSSSTKNQVLDIVENNFVDATTKKNLLKQLPADSRVGNVYQYLLKEHFPSLRSSTMLSFYLKPQPKQQLPYKPEYQEPVFAPVIDEVKEEQVVVNEVAIVDEPLEKVGKIKKAKETVFSLKTNLLYDAATMVNAEIEIPIGKRFSIMIEDVFPWWEFVKNKYALQHWQVGFEPRFWFKPWGNDDMKMLGFFVGPYFAHFKSDFQWDKAICYQAIGHSAGVTGGFVIPLGKRKHWGNMEFSISVGWAGDIVNTADEKGNQKLGVTGIRYQHYQPAANYEYLVRDPYNAGNVQYFGPTKAKVSLIIPINFSTKKSVNYAAQKK